MQCGGIGVDKFFKYSPPIIIGAEKLLEENIVEVGHISHFFSKIGVAVLDLTAPLAVGDRILVKGPSTDFEQNVDSMQIEHTNVARAEKGQSIGIRLVERVRENDVVYKKI